MAIPRHDRPAIPIGDWAHGPVLDRAPAWGTPGASATPGPERGLKALAEVRAFLALKGGVAAAISCDPFFQLNDPEAALPLFRAGWRGLALAAGLQRLLRFARFHGGTSLQEMG